MMRLLQTQIDKIRRNTKKLHNETWMVYILNKYVVVLLLTMLVVFLAYNRPLKPPISNAFRFSDNVLHLKKRFLDQLEIANQNPSQTAKDTVSISENKLFTRTLTVQYLYDYVRAANKELYAGKSVTNGNAPQVQCVTTFSDFWTTELDRITRAVRQFVAQDGTLWTQRGMSSFAKREKITADTNGALDGLIGQFGVIATKDIEQFTCIGHYYGDEYLQSEFKAHFPWDTYGEQLDHPFNKKWDYYMSIWYHLFGDGALGLSHVNATVSIDAFHAYNYEEYVSEGGQVLTEAESKAKVAMEPFVNDARQNLYEPDLTAEDEERLNSDFVYCSVDGVLLPFLVVMKDVKANQQIFTYYGPTYG